MEDIATFSGLQQTPCFILSTGRTGTTSLTRYLKNQMPQLNCHQEPQPSWFFNLYSNLATQGHAPAFLSRFTKRHYLKARKGLLAATANTRYVEINPFIYGMGPELKELFGAIRIIHITRHPYTYIQSIQNFRPQAWRALFRNMPYWNLDARQAVKTNGYPGSTLTQIEKKAWAWRLINEKIDSYRAFAENFQQVRFEKLFTQPSFDENRKLFDALSEPQLGSPTSSASEIKLNASNTSTVLTWQDWLKAVFANVQRICSTGMHKYGYSELGPETIPQ